MFYVAKLLYTVSLLYILYDMVVKHGRDVTILIVLELLWFI